jgi:tripartite-type tricarboxylate transporter receptor subunit TctC
MVVAILAVSLIACGGDGADVGEGEATSDPGSEPTTEPQGEATSEPAAGAGEATEGDDSQAWEPSGPVTMLIPSAPGGGTDALMRNLSEVMQTYLDVPLEVTNVSGGGGRAAGGSLLQADADGHTFSAGFFAAWSFAQAAGELPFDIAEDFRWVTPIRNSDMFLAVAADGPYQTVEEMQAADEPVAFISQGWGSGVREASAIFTEHFGIEQTFIEYEQTAEGFTALVRGDGDAFVTSGTPVVEWAEEGSVLPVAVLGDERDTRLPDIPTLVELGFAEATDPVITLTPFQVVVNMHGDTEDAAVEFYSELFRQVLEDEEFLALAEQADLGPDVANVWRPADETAALIAESVDVAEEYAHLLEE